MKIANGIDFIQIVFVSTMYSVTNKIFVTLTTKRLFQNCGEHHSSTDSAFECFCSLKKFCNLTSFHWQLTSHLTTNFSFFEKSLCKSLSNLLPSESHDNILRGLWLVVNLPYTENSIFPNNWVPLCQAENSKSTLPSAGHRANPLAHLSLSSHGMTQLVCQQKLFMSSQQSFSFESVRPLSWVLICFLRIEF